MGLMAERPPRAPGSCAPAPVTTAAGDSNGGVEHHKPKEDTTKADRTIKRCHNFVEELKLNYISYFAYETKYNLWGLKWGPKANRNCK